MLITVKDKQGAYNDYFVNGERVASSVADCINQMERIVVYEEGAPKYRLVERSKLLWFLTRYLSVISLLISVIVNSIYDIYEGDNHIGASQEKWFKGIRSFKINGDLYQINTHKNEKFSLHKNGKQVALYVKTPEKFFTTTYKPRSYSVSYDAMVPLWIIYLFAAWVDLIFTRADGGDTKKVIVFRDPHPEYTLWQPEASERSIPTDQFPVI